MLNRNKALILAISGSALGAPAALADMIIMHNTLVVDNRSVIDLGEGLDVDMEIDGVDWDVEDIGFDQSWSGAINAGHTMNGLFTSVQSVSNFETSSTGFVHTSTMDLEATSTLNDARVEANGSVSHTAQLMYDEDTEIDVSFHVEYSGVENASRSFMIDVENLENAPITIYTLDSSVAESGSFSIGFRALARANELITLRSLMMGEVDTAFGAVDSRTGTFSITMEVNTVPAPAGAGLLAGLGLVACRRRRGSSSNLL